MQRLYPEKPQRVYFLGTCLADMLYAEAEISGSWLLEREEVGIDEE